MQVEYDLVVDFARPTKSNTIIISEGDANSRKCKFVLLSNKNPFDMLDVSTATVKGTKSDGTVVYGDGTIEKDDDGNNTNVVTYVLPSAISDISGKTTMTITLMSKTGEVVTSFEFYVQTRNSLYSEDDYISDTDLTGFRDLLNRSKAALEKMEAMTSQEALPNPYPLNVYTNTEEYHYSGNETVDIDLGDIAYLADDPVIDIDAVDETAAGIAVDAANRAKTSADSALDSLSRVQTMKGEIDVIETSVASAAAGAAASALTASKAAKEADEKAQESKDVYDNINGIIDEKVTNITNEIASEMIDDIIEDCEDIRDQAAHYKDMAHDAFLNAANISYQTVTAEIKNVYDNLAPYIAEGQQAYSRVTRELIPATESSLGLVQPDGETITVQDGVITAIGGGGGGGKVDIATYEKPGIVMPDGETLKIEAPTYKSTLSLVSGVLGMLPTSLNEYEPTVTIKSDGAMTSIAVLERMWAELIPIYSGPAETSVTVTLPDIHMKYENTYLNIEFEDGGAHDVTVLIGDESGKLYRELDCIYIDDIEELDISKIKDGGLILDSDGTFRTVYSDASGKSLSLMLGALGSKATSYKMGLVMPDGNTTSVDSYGKMSVNVDNLVDPSLTTVNGRIAINQQVITASLVAGVTKLYIQPVSETSVVDLYCEKLGVSPKSATLNGNILQYEFDAQEENLVFKAIVREI